jgi:hypothetical protein
MTQDHGKAPVVAPLPDGAVRNMGEPLRFKDDRSRRSLWSYRAGIRISNAFIESVVTQLLDVRRKLSLTIAQYGPRGTVQT